MLRFHCHLNHSVQFVLEQVVSLGDVGKFVAVRNQWCGVNLARLDETQNLRTIAAVHAARFEGQILAVHIGQGQHLWLIVQRYNRHNRIRASALPRQAEGLLRTCNFQHHISPSTLAFLAHRGDAILWCNNFHTRIMFTHETGSFGRFLAHDDMLRLLQHHAEQRADSRRSCADNQHRVVGLNLRDSCRPKSRRQHIAHEQRLLIAHAVGDAIEALVGIRHTHILRLPAIDATAERPTAIWVGAVVHEAVLAEKTFTAEGLHINRHAVARLDAADLGANLLNHANHLVANGYAGHGTRHTAVLDMQVAGADTAERNAHNGITRALQLGLRLVDKFELARGYVGVSEHSYFDPNLCIKKSTSIISVNSNIFSFPFAGNRTDSASCCRYFRPLTLNITGRISR